MAGSTHSFSFNASTSDFTLTYAPSSAGDAAVPTVIYVNMPLNYPLGVSVSVTPKHALRTVLKPATNQVELYSTGSQGVGLVTVTIQNKAESV